MNEDEENGIEDAEGHDLDESKANRLDDMIAGHADDPAYFEMCAKTLLGEDWPLKGAKIVAAELPHHKAAFKKLVESRAADQTPA